LNAPANAAVLLKLRGITGLLEMAGCCGQQVQFS